jgi:hypothetical protein
MNDETMAICMVFSTICNEGDDGNNNNNVSQCKIDLKMEFLVGPVYEGRVFQTLVLTKEWQIVN